MLRLKRYIQTVSCEEIFPGNFGVGGVKKFLGKKTFLTRKFSGKISSPKILKPKILLETRGNFTRKFGDHLIIELKPVPFPSTG